MFLKITGYKALFQRGEPIDSIFQRQIVRCPIVFKERRLNTAAKGTITKDSTSERWQEWVNSKPHAKVLKVELS